MNCECSESFNSFLNRGLHDAHIWIYYRSLGADKVLNANWEFFAWIAVVLGRLVQAQVGDGEGRGTADTTHAVDEDFIAFLHKLFNLSGCLENVGLLTCIVALVHRARDKLNSVCIVKFLELSLAESFGVLQRAHDCSYASVFHRFDVVFILWVGTNEQVGVCDLAKREAHFYNYFTTTKIRY